MEEWEGHTPPGKRQVREEAPGKRAVRRHVEEEIQQV